MNALGTTRIFIADDHKILRDGVCALIRKQTAMEVVGEAGNGLETIEKIDQTRPDVIILDINHPGMDGIEVAKKLIKKSRPSNYLSFGTFGKKYY